MDDINVQSVLNEILDDNRKARQAKSRRGHKRLDLVEPHTLAKTDDHPHHLVIHSMKSHRVKEPSAQLLKTPTLRRKPTLQVIMQFKARCKVCGGEDAWATQEVEGLDL